MRWTFLLLAVLTLAVAEPAVAAVPATVTLDGRLLTAAGGPVSDGDYTLTFALYAAQDATATVWTEQVAKVAVKGGAFSHELGATKALGQGVLAAPQGLWLAVTVGSEPELPRTPLRSVLYARRAELAEGLQCAGCVDATMLGPQVLAGYAKTVDLSGYVKVSELSDYVKASALAKVAGSGQYGDLSGLPVLAKVGAVCGSGLVVKGIKADGELECGAAAVGGTCGVGEVVVGIGAAGNVICQVLTQTAITKEAILASGDVISIPSPSSSPPKFVQGWRDGGQNLWRLMYPGAPAKSACVVCGTGKDGPLEPSKSVVLSAGSYEYSSITIPAGVTVRFEGDQPVHLKVNGVVRIDGTLDISGLKGETLTPGGAGPGGSKGGAGGVWCNCAQTPPGQTGSGQGAGLGYGQPGSVDSGSSSVGGGGGAGHIAAGYGGYGNAVANKAGGAAYGNHNPEKDWPTGGSGGGGGNASWGGKVSIVGLGGGGGGGGGVLKLEAQEVAVSGKMIAAGGNGGESNKPTGYYLGGGGGGGSGGTIWVRARTVTGASNILVTGGLGGQSTSTGHSGGNGSDGILRLDVEHIDVTKGFQGPPKGLGVLDNYSDFELDVDPSGKIMIRSHSPVKEAIRIWAMY